MANLKSRYTVHPENYDGSGFTDQNSLVRARLDKPDMLSTTLTQLFGAWGDGDRFPLLSMTEGQVGGATAIQGVQYEYPVIGARKTTSKVTSSQYGTGDKPGINNTTFFVVFEDRWFPPQHTIRTADGTTARVMGESVPAVGGGYLVALNLYNPDPAAFCALSNLKPGVVWGISAGATVSESRSVGNWSPIQSPGKRKNQLSILRKSYRFGGNIAQRKVEFELHGTNGKVTKYWIDFEEFQHMLAWREMKEEHLWLSEYNRDAYGVIPLIDQDTQQPIPTGAGLKQQIPNITTYSTLTEKLIRTIIGDTMNGTPDTKMMDIMLFCGDGFAEDFDTAMKGSALFTQIAQSVGGNFIKSAGGNLQLGGYFTSFKSVDGHVVTLKRLPFLNHGGYADSSARHPITGRPMSAYEAYFVDASRYDGQANLRAVYQQGRAEIRGLHQGMSIAKGSSFEDYNGNAFLRLATERDETSVHFMCTTGIQMMRDTNSFALLPLIS